MTFQAARFAASEAWGRNLHPDIWRIVAVSALASLVGCAGAPATQTTGAAPTATERSATASAPSDGMVRVASEHSVKETINRLEELAKQRGLRVFARVDHSAGAASVGQSLRPTELLIFGNPQGGTPLMACAQTFGIDLPLKALAYEAVDGKIYLAYNSVDYLMKRHGAGECPAAANVARAIDGLVRAATAAPGASR